METNFSLRNANIIKNDSTEAKTVTKADNKNFGDSVIDGTNTNQEELLKDVEGAMKTKDNVFIKTDKGIIKIDKDKVPEVLAGLKEKLARKDEYKVTGIGLDTGTNEFKVNFTKTPEGERTDAIENVNVNHREAVAEAHKEYDQGVSNALKITDPGKRAEALQKATTKFETFYKTAIEVYSKNIKAVNDQFLETVKTKDPGHYQEIKKAADENINSRIKNANKSLNVFVQEIQIRCDFLTTSSNLKNPVERKKAIAQTETDFHNNVAKNRKETINSIKTSDDKYASDLNSILHPVNKADSQRTDAIENVNVNHREAVAEAHKEYDQGISNALKITDPGKRAEALQKATTKFETFYKTAIEVYSKNIKAVNEQFLDTVKTKDPGHYQEIKKAADENINSRIKNANKSLNVFVQEIQIRCDFLTTSSNLKNPVERKKAIAQTETDFHNNVAKNRKETINSIKTSDDKYASDLNVALSKK